MKTLKQSFHSLSLIVLGIVFAIGVNIALAVWTGPSQNPPEGNVAEPFNVSSNTQILQGSKTIQGNQITDILYLGLGTAINGILGVNGITQFFSVPISAIFDGNVGIGTASPSAGGEQNLKLDVEGAIGAKYYCDENGNNCSSAPLGETIAFSARKNSVNQLIPGYIWTKITFTTEESDIGNYYDASNSRYIPPAGTYYIGGAYFQDVGPRDMLIGIYKNGVRIKGYYGNSNSGGGGSTNIGTVVNVNGTDYIEIYAFFGADTTIKGDSATLYLGDTSKTYFYGFKIDSGSGSGATDSRFGGAYMHDGTANKVCINSNPQTGGCSCPIGFTAIMSGQTNVAGHDSFICQK